MKYNRQLMMAILHDKVQIAKNVNATVIPLDQAPQGYQEFDKGAARKYVIDPHGMVACLADRRRRGRGLLPAPPRS